ncbi:MAG: molybdopterin-guanine dinucleotide biosynthesis protein B [Gammaproteobacteria bacterium]|nr:molybdopterin-guanine dinucleotide biosynthesis protein B [Gammaproteobacteria bacterium]
MSQQSRLPPVIGFSAYSGTGKTTLLKKIIALLRKRDIRLAVIKHAHHDFEIDHPGKDSFELRKADAYQMLISSGKRKALITEFASFQDEPSLNELINDLDHENIDLILVEGFKREHFAKIELHRESLNKPYLFENDSDIIALATDHPVNTETDLMLLDMNNPDAIADFIFNLVY